MQRYKLTNCTQDVVLSPEEENTGNYYTLVIENYVLFDNEFRRHLNDKSQQT